MEGFPEFLKQYLPEERLNKENIQTYEYEQTVFYRLRKDTHDFPRGSVFWDGGYLKGYQRIKRIINLEEGIKRYFKEPFYVEEKMDGYNIRIRLINNKIYTFTRGGFVCPFTMDRLEDLIPVRFFEKYPDYTLCGEIVGPDNPYNSEEIPYMKQDIAFFAFDLKNSKDQSLTPSERYRIFSAETVPMVRRWGPYTTNEIRTIRELILELDKESREGIVLKSISGKEEAKYVTVGSCIRDLRATSFLFTELPGGFYIQRLIRIGTAIKEFGLNPDEFKQQIGDALLGPLMETINEVSSGEQIREFFRIRVNKKETIDHLLQHLHRAGISARVVSVERIENRYVATFYRVYPKGTKILRQRLKGHGFYD